MEDDQGYGSSVCCLRSVVLGAQLVVVVVGRGCCALVRGWGVWVGVLGFVVVLLVLAAVPALSVGFGVRVSCRLCLGFWLFASWVGGCAFCCFVRFGFVAPPVLEGSCRLVMAVGWR